MQIRKTIDLTANFFAIFYLTQINNYIETPALIVKRIKEYSELSKYIQILFKRRGDVPITYADTSDLERDFGYKPLTSLREGLRRFAEWYKSFYK